MTKPTDSKVVSTLIPYLVVDDCADAIEFYKRAFGAVELFRMPTAAGISHAEVRIGESLLLISGEEPDIEIYGPRARGGATAAMVLYVGDVHATVGAALGAGAKLERAIEERTYGDRSGTLIDPFGHRWIVATHFDDLAEPVDDMLARSPEPAEAIP